MVVAATTGVAAAKPTATTKVATTKVATTTIRFVDPDRSTPATPTQPASDDRVLVTTIRFPVGTTRALPLIVLAHGLNGHPHQLDELAEAWAAAGFVVAAPKFPRVNQGADGKAILADAAEYPGDVSFVISEMTDVNARPGPLHARIDPTKVGTAGMSLGGMAVYGLVSNTCCLDRRVDAAILMGAVRRAFPSGVYHPQGIPVMLVQGDADTGYGNSVRAYPELAPPRWFITLRGGRHGPPFEDDPDEFDEFVRTATTAFWQRYLAGDRTAAERIVTAVARSDGKASLKRELR